MIQNGTEKIKSNLSFLPSQHLEALKKLFWEELNYEPENSPLTTNNWPDQIPQLLIEPPLLFASSGEGRAFHIIVCHLQNEKMNIVAERQIVNQLLKEHPYALYIFSNSTQDHWHFVNVVHEESEKAKRRRILRRISISPEDRLRTASERISRLNIQLINKELFDPLPITIQKAHENAFDVEAVTEEFFDAYKEIFIGLQKYLNNQSRDLVWAHDFSLLFLNRLMFLYYIQRKRWLGDNPDFLHGFWKTYNLSQRAKDTFVSEWLNILFFEAFNNQFQAGRADRAYLPENLREAMQAAPYLNGGLFRKNELDQKFQFLIPDRQMNLIFEFLDKYNFTISEDTPLDQEVAVDPEMIGKVYESLVNVSAEADEQGDAGIFYTPRIEIDLMCRLSLVDWLTNHLGQEHKPVLYELVFAFNLEDKETSDAKISQLNLWQKIDNLFNQVAILDPACGSGSFLVGMLYILDDLLIRSGRQLGHQEDSYDRRKRIIGNNLYGVDVMGWAVHVAELRLWLQLVIETELDKNKLQFKPLLPDLSFKIRRGDSLVQEYGGLNFSLQRAGGQIPFAIKNRINQLKSEKLKFFNNDLDCKFKTEEQVKHEEFLIFKDTLEEKHRSLQTRLDEIEQIIQPTTNLLGEIQDPQMTLDIVKKLEEKEDIQNQLVRLNSTLRVLQTEHEIPLIWDISFVEIFESEKSGFDVVIGNPPYVRQEKIHDPNLSYEKSTLDNRKEYKDKLQRAVYSAWPKTFGYSVNTGKVTWQLNNRSDYYIYFYFLCIKLVNSAGVFCFITSNSWLDVGYGRDLQHFLLTRARIKLILDNQAKRSFASADVNTVIVLFSSAEDTKRDIHTSLNHPAHFIMFKVAFENGLDAVLWEEIEDCCETITTPEFRCLTKTQQALLKSGIDTADGSFAGDKWGGKFLRAPDIYWTILEKAKDKLVRLGDIADVRFGIKTGANEFFYLDGEKIKQWGIEEEFLEPIIKSPRECRKIFLSPEDVHNKLLICHKTKLELKGKNVLEYLKWGESLGFQDRPSCKNRNLWWDLGINETPDVVWFKSFNEKYIYPIVPANVLISDRFYKVKFNQQFSISQLALAFNNPIVFLSTEINGRVNLGAGALDNMTYEAANNYIINPTLLPKEIKIIDRDILPIGEEINKQDRREFDCEVFQILSLSQFEIAALYIELHNATNNRLNKANNF
jgi:hypothetical protein